MTRKTTYQFDRALLPDGWCRNARITVDDRGDITATGDDGHTEPRTEPHAEIHYIRGIAVPGMANSHSHAFQRAMAGMTEYRVSGQDTFWSWRDRMYDFALRLAPEDMTAIAAQAYIEMLKAGYTTVAEFHYLHHDPAGRPYADRPLMARAVLDAAATAGIGLTLLPTLYMYSDFGEKPPTTGQRRFVQSPESFLELKAALDPLSGPQTRIGLAFHSLRAVSPAAMRRVLDALPAASRGPLHIHAAEQRREVEAALEILKARPVEWLLDHADLGPGWCLVHATHMTARETERLAASGAVAAICPSTEGNLGDGFFPLADYLAHAGQIAIGSDSHIAISPAEDLRWLEYGQRLLTQSRNVAASDAMPHTGARLWAAACAGGARAAGRPVGSLAPGQRADILVLDGEGPVLSALRGDQVLDALVFSGQPAPIRDVMAGGRWVVRDGHHAKEDDVLAHYRQTMKKLVSP